MELNRSIYSAIAEGNEEKLAAAIMDELDMHVKAEALVTTVRHQQTRCVRTLLREGCDPCLKHAGRTALYWAVRLDDAAMLEILLEDLLLILEEGICLPPTIKRTHSGSGRVDLYRAGVAFDRLKLQVCDRKEEKNDDRLEDDVFDDDQNDVLETRDLFPDDQKHFQDKQRRASLPIPLKQHEEFDLESLARENDGKRSPSKRYTRSKVDKMKARAQRAINEALFEAASHGSCKCIKILLAAHADPNYYFYHDDEFLSWSTPLLAACFAPVYCRNKSPDESRYIEVVESLVNHGADIGKTNCYGDTALHWAAVAGMCNVVLLLLRNGADLNLKNSYGRTPLLSTLEHNGDNLESMCALLIKWGAKLDIQDKDQWTALHYAVDRKNLAVAKMLLEKGAQVNCLVDISLVPSAVRIMVKMTPLDIAITAEHTDLVRLLLQWNADVNTRSSFNSYFKSAVELAYDSQNIDILQMLAFAGASSRFLLEGFPKLQRDLPQEVDRLWSMISSPHLLKHLVRLRIRFILGNMMKIEMLPIPRLLREYLFFCDL